MAEVIDLVGQDEDDEDDLDGSVGGPPIRGVRDDGNGQGVPVQDVGEVSHENSFTLVVPGNPRPYPRVTIRGRAVWNRNRPAQVFISTLARDAMRARVPLGGIVRGGVMFPRGVPLSVSITFNMRRPALHFVNRDRSRGLRSDVPTSFVTIPDLDNLIKLVLDGLNGIVFDDDMQVVTVHAHKSYDNDYLCEGSTFIVVTQIRN